MTLVIKDAFMILLSKENAKAQRVGLKTCLSVRDLSFSLLISGIFSQKIKLGRREATYERINFRLSSTKISLNLFSISF